MPSSGPNALGADLQALSRNGVNGSALSLGDAASSLGPAFSRPTSPIQNDISPLSEDVPSERPPLPEKDSAVTSRSPPDARLPNRATSPTPSTASRSRAGSRSTANGPFPRRVVSRQGSSSSLGYQGHLAAVRAAAEAASASFDALHGTQTPPEAYRQSMDSDRDHARTNGSQTPSGQTTRGQGIDSARFLARFQQEGKGPPPQTLLDALARLEQAEDGAGEDFAPPSLPWVPGHSRSSSSDSAKKRRSGSIDMISRRGVTEDGSMTSGRGWTDNMPSSHAKTPPDPPAKVEGLQASGIRANNPPGDAAVTAAATQVVGDMMPHAVERQIPGTRDEITVHVGAFHGADRETRVPHGNGDASALGFEPEPNGTTVGLASGTALDEFPLKPRCSANAVNGNEHKDSSAADTLLALASSRSASRLDNPSQDSLGAAGPSPREVAEPLRPETEALATRPVMEESAVKGLGLDQVSPTSQTPSDGLETGADSANTAAEVLPPAIG